MYLSCRSLLALHYLGVVLVQNEFCGVLVDERCMFVSPVQRPERQEFSSTTMCPSGSASHLLFQRLLYRLLLGVALVAGVPHLFQVFSHLTFAAL